MAGPFSGAGHAFIACSISAYDKRGIERFALTFTVFKSTAKVFL